MIGDGETIGFRSIMFWVVGRLCMICLRLQCPIQLRKHGGLENLSITTGLIKIGLPSYIISQPKQIPESCSTAFRKNLR